MLPGGAGIYDVCEKDPTDVMDYMTEQQREDITSSAQVYNNLYGRHHCYRHRHHCPYSQVARVCSIYALIIICLFCSLFVWLCLPGASETFFCHNIYTLVEIFINFFHRTFFGASFSAVDPLRLNGPFSFSSLWRCRLIGLCSPYKSSRIWPVMCHWVHGTLNLTHLCTITFFLPCCLLAWHLQNKPNALFRGRVS